MKNIWLKLTTKVTKKLYMAKRPPRPVSRIIGAPKTKKWRNSKKIANFAGGIA